MDVKDLICENLTVNENHELLFAGQNVAALARKYGTPLYLMDEDRIRERCRTYLAAVKETFGDKGRVYYASKAASYKRMYEVMREEGMGVDVVSCGELYTALQAGFPAKNVLFHSNNKTFSDIDFAMDHGVGCFVADNAEELVNLNSAAEERGITQKVLLRLTPGIDPHTYEAVSTGKVDSKFGFSIDTGKADVALFLLERFKNLDFAGFHCHIGSQVFDSSVYLSAAAVMLEYAARARDRYGLTVRELDLGGGYGVRYVKSQPRIDIAANIKQVGAFIKEKCAALDLDMPVISFEPGRSIVADAGLTVYTVGSVKNIIGYKTYVSVDGGMTDNPRYALYGAPYTVLPVQGLDRAFNMECTVAGRCCESGDIIQPGVMLPENILAQDLLACLTTGAYHYSMASNYNRIPRPPVVTLSGGRDFVSVRRETLDDLIKNDV